MNELIAHAQPYRLSVGTTDGMDPLVGEYVLIMEHPNGTKRVEKRVPRAHVDRDPHPPELLKRVIDDMKTAMPPTWQNPFMDKEWEGRAELEEYAKPQELRITVVGGTIFSKVIEVKLYSGGDGFGVRSYIIQDLSRDTVIAGVKDHIESIRTELGVYAAPPPTKFILCCPRHGNEMKPQAAVDGDTVIPMWICPVEGCTLTARRK